MDFLAAARLGQNLECPVGDYFVRIHVGRRAGAGLKNIDDKLIVELSFHDLVGGLSNSAGKPRFQQSQLFIGARGSVLDRGKRADELARKTDAAHWEILRRAA